MACLSIAPATPSIENNLFHEADVSKEIQKKTLWKFGKGTFWAQGLEERLLSGKVFVKM